MKIAIIGYGKMGKAIEILAKKRGHEVCLTIDNNDDWNKNENNLSKCDVAIEFSMPNVVIKNLKRCIKMNLPVVTGTTGWLEQLSEIKELCNIHNSSLFYASNFSIGVNLFYEINDTLAKLMDSHNEYDVSVEETHHTQKLDAPSGTAINILKQILNKIKRKEEWVDISSYNNDKQIVVSSKRIDNVIGIHNVTYESDIDKIEIFHKAKSREGFAIGALTAAEWLISKKGVYTMTDMLFDNK